MQQQHASVADEQTLTSQFVQQSRVYGSEIIAQHILRVVSYFRYLSGAAEKSRWQNRLPFPSDPLFCAPRSGHACHGCVVAQRMRTADERASSLDTNAPFALDAQRRARWTRMRANVDAALSATVVRDFRMVVVYMQTPLLRVFASIALRLRNVVCIPLIHDLYICNGDIVVLEECVDPARCRYLTRKEDAWAAFSALESLRYTGNAMIREHLTLRSCMFEVHETARTEKVTRVLFHGIEKIGFADGGVVYDHRAPDTLAKRPRHEADIEVFGPWLHNSFFVYEFAAHIFCRFRERKLLDKAQTPHLDVLFAVCEREKFADSTRSEESDEDVDVRGILLKFMRSPEFMGAGAALAGVM